MMALLLCWQAESRAESPSSPEAFQKNLLGYDFAKDREGFGVQLSIEEPRQPEMPAKRIAPERTTESTILWQSPERAVLVIKARPATQSTPSETALLIALERSSGGWIISDKRPFKATGKDAGIRFEITSHSQTPYPDAQGPVVTITASEGGRGASSRVSASYTLVAGKLILKTL